LRKDLEGSKKLLEDITGTQVHGYRAPSFSVSDEILKIIEDAGYQYDASYNSFDKHGRYGKLALDGYQKQGIAHKISENFHELPVSNLQIQNSKFKTQNCTIPCSGGGYFRLFPLCLFKMGVRKLLKKDGAYHFYFHPWEIDADQPHINDIPRMLKFRHYVNIKKTEGKTGQLLRAFAHCRYLTLSQYLQSLECSSGFEKTVP
jgi:polysaccharide deacetylase family protein (PEP-CTERM system associated)